MSVISPLTLMILNLWRQPELRWPLHLLLPFSGLMRLAIALRKYAYEHGWLRVWRAPVPVIVVGNLYVGGTGKTPLTLALVELLRSQGHRPGVISRGYKAPVRGLVQCVAPQSDPSLFGDEPVLLARRAACPVYVHPRRKWAAQALLASHPEVTVLLCDDGLQHYALARDLEIVVTDARGLGNQQVLPAGPLREPPGRLARIPIWACHASLPPMPPGSQNLLLPFNLAPLALRSLPGDIELGWSRFVQQRVLLFAGIGAPDRFFTSVIPFLQAAGAASWETCSYPDHHLYNHADLAGIASQSKATIALCTEKDAVKCRAFARDLPIPITYLVVQAEIAPDALPAFTALLNSTCAKIIHG